MTQTSTDIAVSISGVRKSFGAGDTAVVALRHIDLEVRFGELLLLVGPSGCGKTTLLSVMAGILDADEGDIHLFGTTLTELSGAAKTRFRRENMGFLFQQYNLLPTLTAEENVAVPRLIAKQPRSQALAKAREYLARLGLEDRVDSLPSQLSGGQQQRVAIARALVGEPRLVICDEPTASWDGDMGRMIMDLMRNVARRPDRCLVVVTHDSRIFEYGDRIAEMLDGKIQGIHDNTGGAEP
jgi:putative ABC transport system ATP-binding protein